jgi:hypothetical protein
MTEHLNASGKPKKFVGPTQGLRSRSGQCLLSNLENIGGRILIQAEMTNHKERMRHVKAQVNITPPWSHQQLASLSRPGSSQGGVRRPPSASAASGSRAGNSTLAITQSSSLERPSSAAGHGNSSGFPAGGAASVARSHRSINSTSNGRPPSGSAAAPPEFDMGKLTDEQQATYRDMLRMLSGMSTGDSKLILEQLYRESEDRKLLAAYTGVFPGLEREGLDQDRGASTSNSSRAGKGKATSSSRQEGDAPNQKEKGDPHASSKRSDDYNSPDASESERERSPARTPRSPGAGSDV